jgi:hypothetical protein
MQWAKRNACSYQRTNPAVAAGLIYFVTNILTQHKVFEERILLKDTFR